MQTDITIISSSKLTALKTHNERAEADIFDKQVNAITACISKDCVASLLPTILAFPVVPSTDRDPKAKLFSSELT